MNTMSNTLGTKDSGIFRDVTKRHTDSDFTISNFIFSRGIDYKE